MDISKVLTDPNFQAVIMLVSGYVGYLLRMLLAWLKMEISSGKMSLAAKETIFMLDAYVEKQKDKLSDSKYLRTLRQEAIKHFRKFLVEHKPRWLPAFVWRNTIKKLDEDNINAMIEGWLIKKKENIKISDK